LQRRNIVVSLQTSFTEALSALAAVLSLGARNVTAAGGQLQRARAAHHGQATRLWRGEKNYPHKNKHTNNM
jgi:hypothetical protein